MQDQLHSSLTSVRFAGHHQGVTVTVETPFTVRKSELEAPYNHLNHCLLIKQLETARYHFLETVGIPAPELIKRGHLIVVVGLTAEFLREVKEGEGLVCSCVASMSDRQFVMSQELFNHRRKLAVRAQVTLACMSGETRRGVAIPHEIKSRILG